MAEKEKVITLAEIEEGLSKHNERYRNYSIEIDCPPGNPRPGDCIGSVLKDTGLEVEDFETGPPFFGHQVWVLKESAAKDDLYTSVRHTVIKPRLEQLYYRGVARYCTW